MDQRIYVKLSTEEMEALLAIARAELRHPREQLRLLVREAARARGLMSKTSADCLTIQPAEPTSQAV